MMAYSDAFARVYDEFTQNADYETRGNYIKHFFQQNGIDSGLLLDLACGTGTLSLKFAEDGYDVIGVDLSGEMLNIAREKAEKAKQDILFLSQDMTELDLYGTVKAALCSLDSLNHLYDEKELEEVIRRVALFTEPGGVFVFDVNTLYKHKVILADNTFVYENDASFLVWQNFLNDDGKTVDIVIDVFTQTKDGKYVRESEEFTETAFEETYIRELLKKYGFCKVSVYGDLSLQPPKENEERIYYVAIKGDRI